MTFVNMSSCMLSLIVYWFVYFLATRDLLPSGNPTRCLLDVSRNLLAGYSCLCCFSVVTIIHSIKYKNAVPVYFNFCSYI